MHPGRRVGLSVPGTSPTLGVILHCRYGVVTASPPVRFWRVSAAQHSEVKDAPGSLGWLGHFLGSLAGVHLASADQKRWLLVSQHLMSDKAARN